MESSPSVDKLLPALLLARKAIAPAQKGGRNEYDKYSYAKLEDWHRAVMPALLDNGLVLSISSEDIRNLEPRKTKADKNEYVVEVVCKARLWHISGQWIEVGGVGQGQDRADKAAYKALTGCAKYLYAQMFALPTTDDPEGDETVGGASGASTAPPKASKPDTANLEDLI